MLAVFEERYPQLFILKTNYKMRRVKREKTDLFSANKNYDASNKNDEGLLTRS